MVSLKRSAAMAIATVGFFLLQYISSLLANNFRNKVSFFYTAQYNEKVTAWADFFVVLANIFSWGFLISLVLTVLFAIGAAFSESDKRS